MITNMLTESLDPSKTNEEPKGSIFATLRIGSGHFTAERNPSFDKGLAVAALEEEDAAETTLVLKAGVASCHRLRCFRLDSSRLLPIDGRQHSGL